MVLLGFVKAGVAPEMEMQMSVNACVCVHVYVFVCVEANLTKDSGNELVSRPANGMCRHRDSSIQLNADAIDQLKKDFHFFLY